MREVRVGDRVIYNHKDGGFNATVTKVHGGEEHIISLVYVDPRSGEVTEKKRVPNMNHAHEEREVDQIVKPGLEVTDIKRITTKTGSIVKVGKIKKMVSKAHGHWRR